MKQFPIVQVSGAHYEVGRAVGEVMKESIKKLFDENKSKYSTYFTRFKDQSSDIFLKAKEYFPQYIDELQGMADGTDLDIEELFLSNGISLGYFEDQTDPNHCTIVAISSGGGYLLGHNEDWEPDMAEYLFLLDAEIEGIKIFGLAYDFANTIIGDAVSINQFGLVQAINDVPQKDKHLGVPKAFIARAICDSKTLDDAKEIIKKVPRRTGFNHFLIEKNRVWNIETSAKEYAIEKVELQKYVHTNHYITQLSHLQGGAELYVSESKIRYEKAKRVSSNLTAVDDIKKFLSDTKEPPICRPGTIGSVIFDIPNKVAHVAYGQPTPESYVEYSLAHVLQ